MTEYLRASKNYLSLSEKMIFEFFEAPISQ
jgi:hypothetical protein